MLSYLIFVIYCDKAIAKDTIDNLPNMEQNEFNEYKRVELLAMKRIDEICLKTSNPDMMSEIINRYMGNQSLKQRINTRGKEGHSGYC